MNKSQQLPPALKGGPRVQDYIKTTWNDVRKPNCERRETEVSGFYSRMGRSTVNVTCPFCGTDHQVYLWSFSGCGRRCDVCGAIMGPTYAARLMTKASSGKSVNNPPKSKPSEPKE